MSSLHYRTSVGSPYSVVLGWLILFLSVISSAVGCSFATEESAGLLVVNSPDFHFGERGQKEVLKHVFVLRNQSTEAAELLSIQSSCKCLDSDYGLGAGDNVIAPGKTLHLPVSFTTGSSQSTASAKVVAKYRFAGADDIRSLVLSVRADILPDFRIEPDSLDFGDLTGVSMEHARKSFRVVPVAAKHLEVYDIISSSRYITSELGVRQDDGSYSVNVLIDRTSLDSSGLFNGVLMIHT